MVQAGLAGLAGSGGFELLRRQNIVTILIVQGGVCRAILGGLELRDFGNDDCQDCKIKRIVFHSCLRCCPL